MTRLEPRAGRRGEAPASRRGARRPPLWASAAFAAVALSGSLRPAPAAAGEAEEALRASWVGRHVVLRVATFSNCDERYTDNRLRGTLPSSGGRHRFESGELARVDNLNLRRARVDLLLSLDEPLRVELRDGPFQIYEQLECRVELEVPAPRPAIRQGAVERLESLLLGVLERYDDRAAAERSTRWNRRLVEPLPPDHEERLAAYHAWKEEQLYLALRDRLAEALDRAAEIAARAERGEAYAHGLASGARRYGSARLRSTDCVELPSQSHYGSREEPPEELDEADRRDWRDGFEDGQQLRFELDLARRLERCLP